MAFSLPFPHRPQSGPVQGGTYRVGGDVGALGAGNVEVLFDASAPRLGRNKTQLLGFWDLAADEDDGTAARVALAAGRQPVKVSGDSPVTLLMGSTTLIDSSSAYERPTVFLDASSAGLSLVVAALDGAELEGDAFASGAFSVSSPPPDWNQPVVFAAPSLVKLDGLGPLNSFARWSENLWPEIAGGFAARDLRALAKGRRFVAVWVVGWWCTTDYQTPGHAGFPVLWRVVERAAPPQRLQVHSWPLSSLTGAGDPLPALVTLAPTLQASSREYLVGSVVQGGQGGGLSGSVVSLRDWSDAGQSITAVLDPLWGGFRSYQGVGGASVAVTPAARAAVVELGGPGASVWVAAEGASHAPVDVAAVLSMVRAL